MLECGSRSRLELVVNKIILTHCPSAGGLIRQLFQKLGPGWKTHIVASHEDFSQGPLPTHGVARNFFLERQTFWKSLDLYVADINHEFDRSEEHASCVKEIKSGKQAEIWITNSVQAMFNAVVTVRLLMSDGVDTSDISTRSFIGHQVRWGLGATRVEELELLYKNSEAAPLDTRLYCDAWSAISQGSAEEIKRFTKRQEPSSPMAQAFSAYLLRLPEFNGGLGSIERALLAGGTKEMKNSAYTVGDALAFGEPENDHIGDLVLFSKLVDLSRIRPNPWFNIEGDHREMRSCSAQITESGELARAKYAVQPY